LVLKNKLLLIGLIALVPAAVSVVILYSRTGSGPLGARAVDQLVRLQDKDTAAAHPLDRITPIKTLDVDVPRSGNAGIAVDFLGLTLILSPNDQAKIKVRGTQLPFNSDARAAAQLDITQLSETDGEQFAITSARVSLTVQDVLTPIGPATRGIKVGWKGNQPSGASVHLDVTNAKGRFGVTWAQSHSSFVVLSPECISQANTAFAASARSADPSATMAKAVSGLQSLTEEHLLERFLGASYAHVKEENSSDEVAASLVLLGARCQTVDLKEPAYRFLLPGQKVYLLEIGIGPRHSFYVVGFDSTGRQLYFGGWNPRSPSDDPATAMLSLLGWK
jgi:hypothetical protein